MTAIAGLIYDGKVYIGGDSAGVDKYDVVVRKDTKVFRVKDFIFGYTSSFRMGQLIRFSFVPPQHDPDVDAYEYMCTLFVEELRKCLKDGGYAKIDNNVEEGGQFLVGYKGCLFDIQSDFQVGETVYGYNACGCGMNYILGSLYTSEKCGVKDPMARIEMALSAAEEFSGGVRGPFNFEILEY